MDADSPTAGCPGTQRTDHHAFLFAVAAACLVLTVGLLAFALSLPADHPNDPRNAAHIFDAKSGFNRLLMSWDESWPQRLAHRSMLVALGVICGMLWLVGARRADALVTSLTRPYAPVVITASIGVLIVLCSLGYPDGFEYVESKRRYVPEFGLGILLTAALFAVGRRLTSRGWNRAALALTFAFLVALLAPASWSDVDFSGVQWTVIEEWQWHYESILMGATDRLAAGQPLSENLTPWYGLVLPVVLGGIQRRLQPWNFGDYVAFAQWMQAVFLFLLLLGYGVYARRRWLLCLIAVVFVGIDYHPNTYLLVYLNLMGWRFLAFPVAILGYVASHRLPSAWAALLLGCVSGFCLLYNIETGVAASAGLCVCAFLRQMGSRTGSRLRWLGEGLLFPAGVSLAAGVFFVLHRLALGEWMNWESLSAITDLLVLHGGGLGTESASLNLLAVVAFGHAAAAVVHVWLERRTPLSLRRGMRALAATIVLIWFAYYANRPNAVSLQSVLVPYSFLLIDTVRATTLGRRGFRVGGFKIGLSAATLALVVIPHIVRVARLQWDSYANGVERAFSHEMPLGRRVQGIWLPDDARTQRIISQSEFLRGHPRAEPLIYFTVDNLLVAARANAWPQLPLPVANAFYGSVTAEHYRALLIGVHNPDVKRIYFDSWRGLSPAEADASWQIRQFYEQLRADLSGTFVPSRTVAGWEEWVRR